MTLFFTFWGLNLLWRPESVPVKKTLIERIFGFMMPRGAEKTHLSKMTMDLMGIKREELIDGVEEGGVAMYLDRAESANVNLFI